MAPPTPSKVIKLIESDRELFLTGRRAENQGMGIGSFAYYRRVIESQKNKILDEIIRVAQKIGANSDLIKELESAKKEHKFTKAIESIKQTLPEVLLINSHNPLTLLHNALSQGIHGKSDQECLELASSIRVVLFELAERLKQALKDEAELNQAITKLMNSKTKK